MGVAVCLGLVPTLTPGLGGLITVHVPASIAFPGFLSPPGKLLSKDKTGICSSESVQMVRCPTCMGSSFSSPHEAWRVGGSEIAIPTCLGRYNSPCQADTVRYLDTR